MPPWADYVIPIAIVTLLMGSAVAWLALTLLEHAGELGARLGAWWSGQAEAAERRAAERATRKAVPLVSINMGRSAADYVTSDEVEAASPEPSGLRQTAPTDQTDGAAAPVVKSATLDTCRDMRAHGYTREAARAHLRALGWALDNNTWAQAKPEPPDDDLTVTPYAGRVTRRSFYESEPELEYQEPPR